MAIAAKSLTHGQTTLDRQAVDDLRSKLRGIMIDLSPMNAVRVDANNNSARVGAGALWADGSQWKTARISRRSTNPPRWQTPLKVFLTRSKTPPRITTAAQSDMEKNS